MKSPCNIKPLCSIKSLQFTNFLEPWRAVGILQWIAQRLHYGLTLSQFRPDWYGQFHLPVSETKLIGPEILIKHVLLLGRSWGVVLNLIAQTRRFWADLVLIIGSPGTPFPRWARIQDDFRNNTNTNARKLAPAFLSNSILLSQYISTADWS